LKASEIPLLKTAQIILLEEGIFKQRLAEMGCVPGASMTLLFKAPSGDPLAFDVEGYTLGLRVDEANQIIVELTDDQ
jgi:ferrous iron transport protein A